MKQMVVGLIALMSVIVIGACGTPSLVGDGQRKPNVSAPANAYRPCSSDIERQKRRADELQTIVKPDQDDRIAFQDKSTDDLMDMARRDEVRRKRVGEIFGEGCFSTSEDFSAAALVFQHGDAPDHFFQTFLWAKRAVELGDSSMRNLMALGIDRYLVKLGHMQLFASQAFVLQPDDPKSCYCMQPVEHHFPDSLRKRYTGKNLKEAFAWLSSLNAGKSCPALECPSHLKPTPKGTVPGFW